MSAVFFDNAVPEFYSGIGGVRTPISADVFSIYALLAGRASGQTLIGGVASGEDLTLQSTSHATKGNIFFGAAQTSGFDEVNERFGLGIAAPAYVLDIVGSQANSFRFVTSGGVTQQNEFQCSSNTNTHRPTVILRRTRGTSTSPTEPIAFDLLGNLNWQSYNGAAAVTVGQFFAQTSQTHASGTNLGTRIELEVIPHNQTTLRSIFLFSGLEFNFNDDAQDLDFRIEGSSLTHMFFAEGAAASENIALLAASLPAWQAMDRGIFMGDVTTAPTGNPTAGGFLYVVAGALTWRGSGGTVTTIAAA